MFQLASTSSGLRVWEEVNIKFGIVTFHWKVIGSTFQQPPVHTHCINHTITNTHSRISCRHAHHFTGTISKYQQNCCVQRHQIFAYVRKEQNCTAGLVKYVLEPLCVCVPPVVVHANSFLLGQEMHIFSRRWPYTLIVSDQILILNPL